MKLTYIYHSGFVIELDSFCILIDYYKDSDKNPDRGFVHRRFLKYPGRLYILSSHSHADHFNPEILEWKAIRPDIRYILSEDIRAQGQACFHDAIFLKKGENWNDDLIHIQAFGSTDMGISFLIEFQGKYIFHAGDLNNWHWKAESTPEESQGYEENYLKELEQLAQYTERIHLALFPVDPRLGQDYARGAEQFIDRIRIDWFAPMHFWEKYDKANTLKTYAESKGCRFISWHHPNETTTINNFINEK